MGILDGIVEWIAEQIMYGLDMINTSVLGALGCDMNTFLRYFPAAETMYSLLVALAIGLILLGWVWNLFKNYGLGLGVDAEDPVKLTAKAILFIVLAYYADEIVNIALTIGGTPYAWILSSELPSLDFASFNSVLLTIIGVCANGGVALIVLILTLILAWNYITHGNYLCVDGLYYAYLLVPSDGYKARVPAGWLSLLVNAGDGIDLDVFLARQPKDRMVRKLGQQLRINRSKIKETSDTNTDFDDLDGAIRSGYFLKDGLSNNEDFYYLNLLITVTAGSVDDLEWKVAEMKKLLLSQDMDVQTCSFCQEQAFLSSLPLVSLERQLYERSKRNVLTTGAASCYPFTSYEMCDDNGILLGVNKHNNSLIIVDIFDSRVYKNANIAILGTSGAGKTFTLQLMALRMRRKGIQVFIIAPLKGHEFHRACSNIGGQFISISPASQNCINIMEIRKADKSVDDLLDGPGAEKSLLAAKIQRLHTFFSLLIPDMSHEERQLLDDAMICTYGVKGITHDNASLEQLKNPGCYKEMPILGDLYEILAASPETKRLANILNRLVNGSARSFNQQTNVALDNKYIVLDISELTGDLLTVGMFVALDFVWDKAKENRTAEKAIFVDECWQLIGASSNRQAAESVLELAKTIRGYGGSLVCATQDLNDFFALDDGKYGKGIINNSKTKILLNLEEEEAQRVQGVLHLSEAELMEITHFERGSALISTNNNNIAVEIKCSQMEKELITTDRRELAELAQRAAPKQHPC